MNPNPLLDPALARRGSADGWRTSAAAVEFVVKAARREVQFTEAELLALVAGSYDAAAMNAFTFSLVSAFLEMLTRTGDLAAAEAVVDGLKLRGLEMEV